MNTFRSKGIFWGLMALTSIFVMAFGFRAVRNGTAMNISDIYAIAVFDAILIGLIIPGVSLLVIKEVDGYVVDGSKKEIAGNLLCVRCDYYIACFFVGKYIFRDNQDSCRVGIYAVFIFIIFCVFLSVSIVDFNCGN